MFSLNNEFPSIILDIGSESTKAGIGGEDAPHFVFSSYYGQDLTKNEYYVGDKVLNPRLNSEILKMKANGSIGNWESVMEILDHLFKDKLQVDASDYPILLSETYGTEQGTRSKFAEILFEKFQIPALYFAHDAVLSLFALGKSSGLVVDLGSTTRVVPVHEGYILRSGIGTSQMGSILIEDLYRHLLHTRGTPNLEHKYFSKNQNKNYNTNTSNQMNLNGGFQYRKSHNQFFDHLIYKDMKESLSNVVQDKDIIIELIQNGSNSSNYVDLNYELPNKMLLADLQLDSSLIVETWFSENNYLNKNGLNVSHLNPNFSSNNIVPIQDLVAHSINNSLTDIKQSLSECILFTGGGALTKGIIPRAEKEIQNKMFKNSNCKVIQFENSIETRFSSWIGGSILSSLTFFQHLWISKKQYQENGPQIVEEKFLKK
ncbi:brahma associated protein 55kd [Anaeramoeba flamelloides]|uniref:Brahma associated protein 55kd n=1 Tax=Anaeramoeba flamelloides TaxID=1746091 RepID=A0ABQ8XK94_9EUKA|nr:brahma associated protein 55kd [Anaeramoeba flamelloides]